MHPTVRRELDVVIHGQSARFRIVKYIVLLSMVYAIRLAYDWSAVLHFLLLLVITGASLHFFFRYKTKGWTTSWWLFKTGKSRTRN